MDPFVFVPNGKERSQKVKRPGWKELCHGPSLTLELLSHARILELLKVSLITLYFNISSHIELMLQMNFQIYSDDLTSLLFRTPLMMVDSIRVWTESSRMLDYLVQTGKDQQFKSYILECPKREPTFVSILLGKSVFVNCSVFQLILAYWHKT